MDALSRKSGQWIAAGRDPRSAHWQAALEEVMGALRDCHCAGCLAPVALPDEEALDLFQTCLAAVDLSPDLVALFIPSPLADTIVPPASADELKRISPNRKSAKILVSQGGKDPRILCAEVSPHADKPGFDIFQAGALMGSFHYETHTDCIQALTASVRTHLWNREKWPEDVIRRYTRNWFEKVLDLKDGSVPVDSDHCFLLSPTLIRSDRIDALFELLLAVLSERLEQAPAPTPQGVSLRSDERAETLVLEALNLIRDGKLVAFDQFSAREKERFSNGFAATVKQLAIAAGGN